MIILLFYFQIDEFKCIDNCPDGYLKLGMKCVKVCPAGYEEGGNKSCLKCTAEKCPRGMSRAISWD